MADLGTLAPDRLAVPMRHELIAWSPYTWTWIEESGGVIAEACMPGAYLRLSFTGSTSLAVEIDAPAPARCANGEAPVIETIVDHGPAVVSPIIASGGRSVLELASGLDATVAHSFELLFRAGTLIERWTSPARRLRLGSIRLDRGGRLVPTARRPMRAIGWGDSITEGVGVDAPFTSWSELAPNSSRATWLPIAATALDAEYGQLGSGGQALGTANPGWLPPLCESWALHDAGGSSRLLDGRLDPQPDYVFCNHGTNDGTDPTASYHRWLDGVRRAAPIAQVFVVVPINGFWRAEITAVAAARRAAGDLRVHLIDCPELQEGAPARGRPTALAFDGAHPTALGQALFGAAVAAQAARAIRAATI